MPMSKRQQRNYNRGKRYGSGWRQVYYDADGVCQHCGSPDKLEFHHSDKGLTLSCRDCHIKIDHEDEEAGKFTCHPHGYDSKLAEDIDAEVKPIGLDNWKKLYGIKEKV